MEFPNIISPNIHKAKRVVSLKAKANLHRGVVAMMIDKINEHAGSFSFLLINVFFFGVWIWINTGMINGISPFDPFPFSLLTTFVSLEAIALSIMVLISQNKDAKISDVREEVTLQILLTTEAEITKLLKLVQELQEKAGLVGTNQDKELQKMLKKINTDKITRELEIEIENVD